MAIFVVIEAFCTSKFKTNTKLIDEKDFARMSLSKSNPFK